MGSQIVEILAIETGVWGFNEYKGTISGGGQGNKVIRIPFTQRWMLDQRGRERQSY